MKKAQSFTPAARIASNSGMRNLFIFQYFVYLAASVALCVSTAYYLWATEVPDNNLNQYICLASNSSDDSTMVNVSQRFEDILKIFFTVYFIEFFRNLLVLIAAFTRKASIARAYEYLVCNDCLGFAAFIILHVYRFQ